MSEWLLISITVHSWARWYVKVTAVIFTVLQIMFLVFLAALTVKLAWTL